MNAAPSDVHANGGGLLADQEFRSLAEAMPQIVWATRPDGWNIYFNQQWVDYTGMTLEESYGHGWNTPFHPDDRQRAWEAWQRATQDNERYSLECRLRRADGTYRWWLVRGVPMLGANGEILKWFGTCTDIEELKHTEAALKEATDLLEQRVAERTAELSHNEAMLRAITDNCPDPIFLKDRDSRMLLANPATLTALGKRADEVLGKTDEEFYDDPAQGRQMVVNDRRVMDSGQAETMEEVVPHPAGARTFLSAKTPHRDAAGQVIGLVGVARDITERKRAEEALGASEVKYRNLFQNITEEVHFWRVVRDEHGEIKTWRLVDANPPTLKTWGKTLEEIEGKTTDEIFGPGAAGHFMPIVQKIMTEGIPYSFEDYFPNLDKYFRFTSVPFGEYFITTGADITEIKRAGEAAAKLAAIVDSSDDAIIGKDLNGIVTSWNAGAENMLGYSASEMIGQPLIRIIPPECEEDEARILGEIKRGECVPHFETVRMHKDGSTLDVSIAVSPIKDAAGRIIGASKLARDITERKRAEAMLRESEARSRLQATALQAAANAIAITDPKGNIQWVNDAFTQLTGYSAAEAIGQNPRVLKSGKHEPAFYKGMWDTVLSGHVWHGELVNKRKDGGLYTEEMTIAPVMDATGAITQFIAVKQDITERQRAEQEIQTLNTELEERVRLRTLELQTSNRELEAFCYSVSHDLRAPLRGINGFSQALQDDYADKLDATANNFLQRIGSGCQRMAQLIDDLLKLSRLSRAEMQRRPVNLSEMAQGVAVELRQTEPERAVQFNIAEGLTSVGDPALLRVALSNLMGNAWKFSSNGTESLIEFGSRQDGHAIYFVRDNGTGFDMAYADKLFQPFQRLHAAKEFPGTGVGLATVARVIHRHGGRVWAEAVPGQGATFYFTLEPEAEQHG
jgi:PAS domain S-box-containing protein